MLHLMKSEFIKLRTLRSTLTATIVLINGSPLTCTSIPVSFSYILVAAIIAFTMPTLAGEFNESLFIFLVHRFYLVLMFYLVPKLYLLPSPHDLQM